MRLLCLWSLLLPLTLSAGEEPTLFELPAAPAAPVAQAAMTPPSLPVTRTATGFAAYEAKYELRYDGLKVGELTQRLEAMVEGRQVLQTIAYTTGVVSWFKSDRVTERSSWRLDGVDGERLLPQEYSYRYDGRGKGIVERLAFDWQRREATLRRDGATTSLALEPGTLDKHMYQVALRQALRNGESRISYPVIDGGKIRHYEFEVVGEERLELPHLGQLDCLRVRKGTTLIWVARRFDFLPVKIEKVEEGTTIGTTLIELRGG
jgi:hypothetical protein